LPYPLYFLVVSLPHSDVIFVKAYPVETSEAFCEGHVAAFAFFGGIPLSVLYDNTRLAVAKILGDGTRTRSTLFSGLQSHDMFEDRYGRCPCFLSHPGHQRILRRRRRRAFHREGGKVFSGNGAWICLPAIGNALGAPGSAGASMPIPAASSSPHENPQTEPSGAQAASRSYR
jgi:hypothetical protein